MTEGTALREFGDALVAFTVEPGPDNLVRYLAASRALEDARRRVRVPVAKAPRTRAKPRLRARPGNRMEARVTDSS